MYRYQVSFETALEIVMKTVFKRRQKHKQGYKQAYRKGTTYLFKEAGMYEGPSIVNISQRELDDGIRHAEEQYPDILVDTEILRKVYNDLLRKYRFHKGVYVEVLREALMEHGVSDLFDREAYKCAIFFVNDQRRARFPKKRKKAKQIGEPAGASNDASTLAPIVTSDTGPLSPEEVEAEQKRYNLNEDCLPF